MSKIGGPKMDERAKFEHEMIDRLARIEVKIDDVKSIRKTSEAALSKSTQNEKDIEKINSNITWLWRTTAGAVIVLAVNALIALIKMM
jgi:hypothetical protein